MKIKLILLILLSIDPLNLVAQDTTFTYPSRSDISVTLEASIEKENEYYIYNYEMSNSIESNQTIEEFYIEFFSEVENISNPSTWIGLKSNHEIPVVIWGSNKKEYDIIQGDKISGFNFQSKGIPSVVNFYAAGNIEEPSFDYGEAPSLESTEGLNIFENSLKRKTVGPKELPETIGNPDLLDTIQSYLHLSCDTTWITNQGICRSLEAKLENVDRQLNRGNTNAASGSLEAFINEVEAQKDKQLSSEAYSLLYFNGQYLLEQLNQ